MPLIVAAEMWLVIWFKLPQKTEHVFGEMSEAVFWFSCTGVTFGAFFYITMVDNAFHVISEWAPKFIGVTFIGIIIITASTTTPETSANISEAILDSISPNMIKIVVGRAR